MKQCSKENFIDLLDLARRLSIGETIEYEGQTYAMEKVAPDYICKDCSLYNNCSVGLSLICMFVDDRLYEQAERGGSELFKCCLIKNKE